MTFDSHRSPHIDAATRLLTAIAVSSVSVALADDNRIPLCQGLTVVTAVSQPEGDYESIKTIETIGEDEFVLRYSSEGPNTDMLASPDEPIKRHLMRRNVLIADLESATQYQQIYVAKAAERIPGTTAIGTSSTVLKSLRAGKSIGFSYSNVPGDEFPDLTADRDIYPNYYSYMTNVTLEPVGRSSLSVLVNDRSVELPVIHATSEYLGEKSEFFFLDDDANPLALAFRIGIGAEPAMDPGMAEICEDLKAAQLPMFRSQCRAEAGDSASLRVIKISFRCDTSDNAGGAGAGSGQGGGSGGDFAAGGGAGSGSGAALEQSLEDSGRAEVYSIYFEFNSAEIRKESRETLAEIAAILERRPDWRLSIAGHTDGIDSEEYNLELSRRRAAAVRHALVADYSVDGARLNTEGFGESRPIDTNETIEGRARNRRVELVRLP